MTDQSIGRRSAISISTETASTHLRRALELAEGGRGRVSPNPLVGAVIERDDRVIGEGFHAELGGLHAERAALLDAATRGEDPAGATMYVTLEPCAHTGRQPPCSETIAEAGISRVVIGTGDPSEKTAGRGPEILRAAGVEVVEASGAEAAASRLLVQPFRKHARTGRPHVIYKVASTIDGKVDLAAPQPSPPGGGGRIWISGPESRELVHRWRADCDAVAVGIGTALADDPTLTARGVDAPRQPARVVFDSQARLPPVSNLVATTPQAPLFVVVAPGAPAERTDSLGAAGAELIEADGLETALDALGSRQITSLLLEGGPTLARAFLEAGQVDELRLFVAPLLAATGGATALPAGESGIGNAVAPISVEHETVGADLLFCARLREW
ncbi:MAG: bifunctional diaminohydroxyphosphoribosylaminopyrimidine deaminase/5-amino-6-(5-phosphoribosylamino)uracil reductase RibD [Solirubrobacterales bacterium]